MNRRLVSAVLVGLVLVGLALAGIRSCPFFVFTGIPCPGCGMVRAVLALVTFRFAAAWQLHPLVYIAAPVGAAEVLYLAFPKLPAWKYPRGVVIAALCIFMSVWAVRLATGAHPDVGQFSQGLLSRGWVSLRAWLNS